MSRYFGRTQIFTDYEINDENILKVINKIKPTHFKNRKEIKYLYEYYKGKQPIINRVKEIRPEICNKIVENWANEIVSFKVGYLCGSPIQYTSGNSKDDISQKIDKLNQTMESMYKATKDKDLIEWQMIAGTSYRMILPDPLKIYTLDPRNTFVIYKNDITCEAVAGGVVTYIQDPKPACIFTVYTPKTIYTIRDDKLVNTTANTIGMIPIIEYPANNARLGCFEIVLDLLDAVNDLDSNRLDGVQQTIQSLMVIYNAHLENDDASTLREKGLIELKSVGDAKGDIKIISEQLNQDQTQTLKKDIMQRIREIVGLPSQGDGTTGDSSNNGAAFLKNGWENAETRAKESEIMFKQSEQEFLKVALSMFSTKQIVSSLSLEDINIQFTRRNYENIQVKSQVLTTMLANNKIAPKLAFQSCGMFVDAEEAYRESKEYEEENRRTEQSSEPSNTDGNTTDTEEEGNE